MKQSLLTEQRLLRNIIKTAEDDYTNEIKESVPAAENAVTDANKAMEMVRRLKKNIDLRYNMCAAHSNMDSDDLLNIMCILRGCAC